MRLVKKTASRMALWLCAAALLAAPCSGAAPQAGGQGGEPENHFVIMYDISRSMKRSDKRIKGMVADFLLKVPPQLMPYKIAVIPFAGECPQTNELENPGDTANRWWEIRTGNGEDREKLKDALSQLECDRAGTNIEGALQECCKTLGKMKETNENCSQTVLFITDGLIDLGSGNNRSRMDNIIASGQRVPGIAENFPQECKFWAIMPDEATKKSFLTFDAAGNILTYDEIRVEENQQDGIRAVLTCLEDFCSELNRLGPEGTGTRAGTIPMNWTGDTLQHFKEAYTEFFEWIWDTTTVTREQVELNGGFEFPVPEGTAEVNITVMPEIEDPDRCKQTAEQLAGALLVLRDGEPYPAAECVGSIYTVNVKLSNPPAGTYCLRSNIEEECCFTLDFLTYSDLRIATSGQSVTKALGSTVEVAGSIEDAAGKQIGDSTASSFTLEACLSGEPDGAGERVPIGLDGGSFRYSFTADRVGNSFLTLYAAYDDADGTADSSGISKFGRRETIAITVPGVSYRGGADRDIFGSIALELCPYSNLPEGQVEVPASAAKQYLNDDWAAHLLNGQGDQLDPDIPMELSADGARFVLKCKGRGAETAVMVNRATGEAIEVPIPKAGPFWMVVIAACGVTLMIAAVFVGAVLSQNRAVTVSIRWRGDTAVLRLKRDGARESKAIGGEQVTAWIEKESGQVAARLDGRTKRADIVGNACDINF